MWNILAAPLPWGNKKAALAAALVNSPGCCDQLDGLSLNEKNEVVAQAISQATGGAKLQLLACGGCPIGFEESGLDGFALNTTESWQTIDVGAPYIPPMDPAVVHAFTEVYPAGAGAGNIDAYTIMNDPDCFSNGEDIGAWTNVARWYDPVGSSPDYYQPAFAGILGDGPDSFGHDGNNFAVQFTAIRHSYSGRNLWLAVRFCDGYGNPNGVRAQIYKQPLNIAGYATPDRYQINIAAGTVNSLVEDDLGNCFFTIVEDPFFLGVIGAGNFYVSSSLSPYLTGLQDFETDLDLSSSSVAFDYSRQQLVLRVGNRLAFFSKETLPLGTVRWKFSGQITLVGSSPSDLVRDCDVLGSLVVATMMRPQGSYVGVFDCWGGLIGFTPFLDPKGVEFLLDKGSTFPTAQGQFQRRFVVSGRRTSTNTDELHLFETECDPMCYLRFTGVNFPNYVPLVPFPFQPIPTFPPPDPSPDPTPGPSADWEW